MATTANTVYPIKPVGGAGGTWASDMMTLPCLASDVFEDGDIIQIEATNRHAEEDNSPAVQRIFGVASTKAGGFTANATIDRDGNVNEDVIHVYPAWPGRRFAGNLITNASTDQVGDYEDDLRVAGGNEILEADTSGYAAPSLTNTVPVIYILEYVTPQTGSVSGTVTTQFGREAGVGMLNPRVVFMFFPNETVFSTA